MKIRVASIILEDGQMLEIRGYISYEECERFAMFRKPNRIDCVAMDRIMYMSLTTEEDEK